MKGHVIYRIRLARAIGGLGPQSLDDGLQLLLVIELILLTNLHRGYLRGEEREGEGGRGQNTEGK